MNGSQYAMRWTDLQKVTALDHRTCHQQPLTYTYPQSCQAVPNQLTEVIRCVGAKPARQKPGWSTVERTENLNRYAYASSLTLYSFDESDIVSTILHLFDMPSKACPPTPNRQ